MQYFTKLLQDTVKKLEKSDHVMRNPLDFITEKEGTNGKKR